MFCLLFLVVHFTIPKYYGILVFKSIPIYLGMKRKTFDIAKEVYFVLKKNKELSVKQVADKVGSEWETVIRSLEFFKEIEIAKERKGKKTYRSERLFSLNRRG